MSRETRSIVVALALLACVELWLGTAPAPVAGVDDDVAAPPTDRPLVLLLGSSRTRRGLRPSVIEDVLADAGQADVWVGNASVPGLTTVGLLRVWLEELRPLVGPSGDVRGLVCIEVRGSGLNDGFVNGLEQTWLDTHPLESVGGAAGSGAWAAVTARLADGDVDGACRALMGQLAVARGRETLRPRLGRLLGGGAGAATGAGLVLLTRPWTTGERGWDTFAEPVAAPLRWQSLGDRYRRENLADFALGGVQTRALRELVTSVRAAGLVPVLHVLPITDEHRGFFGPGDHAAYRDHVARLAAELQLTVVDLDARHQLGLNAFYDTHHVNAGAVERVSTGFARSLVPLLADVERAVSATPPPSDR